MRAIVYSLLLTASLFSVRQTKAQEQDSDNAVQLSHDFDPSQRRLTLLADNKDFCDYHLTISFIHAEGFEGMSFSTSLIAGPGRRQIRAYKAREDAARYSYNYRYVMFRGNSSKKPNVDFIYSLPVPAGKEVTAVAVENQEGYQLAFNLPSDTVYACRGGVMCDDNLKDQTAKGHKRFNSSSSMSQVTVYHTDGSFGEYVFRGKQLVYPGQNIKMGNPIGVAERASAYPLRFSAYFLDKNKLKGDASNKHTHFRPFFQTANEGKLRLENDRAYLCEYTDEMLTQEMSKREKKKFLKDKSKKQPDGEK
jgi:hypothetical protein